MGKLVVLILESPFQKQPPCSLPHHFPLEFLLPLEILLLKLRPNLSCKPDELVSFCQWLFQHLGFHLLGLTGYQKKVISTKWEAQWSSIKIQELRRFYKKKSPSILFLWHSWWIIIRGANSHTKNMKSTPLFSGLLTELALGWARSVLKAGLQPVLVMFAVCLCFLDRLPGHGDCSLCAEFSQSPSSFRDHRGCHLLCDLGSLYGQIWTSNWWVPISWQKTSRQPLVLAEVVNAVGSLITVERGVFSNTVSKICSEIASAFMEYCS